MKALVTRVRNAQIFVEGKEVSSIGRGIVVFLGISTDDREDDLVKMADKIVNVRIFENDKGKLHFSVLEKGYGLMCISNFTLCARTDKGRRPSFEEAMAAAQAEKVYQHMILVLESKGIKVAKGVFGAHMDIKLEMDGPVNIVIES